MKNKGFTLIELLVSISIIAILTVLASLSFAKAQKNSRDQRRIDDLKAIQSAAEQYYLLGGSYPPAIGYYRPTAGAWIVNGQVVLNKFPSDPKGVGVTYSVNMVNANGYCVCAKLENTANSNSSDACDFSNPSDNFCIKNQQ